MASYLVVAHEVNTAPQPVEESPAPVAPAPVAPAPVAPVAPQHPQARQEAPPKAPATSGTRKRAQVPAGSTTGKPGAFIADDPVTPQDEAWVEVPG